MPSTTNTGPAPPPGNYKTGRPITISWRDISAQVPCPSSSSSSSSKGVDSRSPLHKSLSMSHTSPLLLDNLSGMVHPGQTLAIMGPSGSGKTTLLDILAGRTAAGRGGKSNLDHLKVTGEVHLNGTPLAKCLAKFRAGLLVPSSSSASSSACSGNNSDYEEEGEGRRGVKGGESREEKEEIQEGEEEYSPIGLIGYVPQESPLDAYLTVYEYLSMAAIIKLSSRRFTAHQRKERVDAALQATNLTPKKHAFIGQDDASLASGGGGQGKSGGGLVGLFGGSQANSSRGLSSGERKRVAIALELIMQPAVLIMDEPTCGLDARTAHSIVQLFSSLQKERPRVIIYTIHQPRSQIYHDFDRLLLLCAGKEIFHGRKDDAMRVFDEWYGYPVKEDGHVNPAEHMLDVLSGAQRSSQEQLMIRQEEEMEEMYANLSKEEREQRLRQLRRRARRESSNGMEVSEEVQRIANVFASHSEGGEKIKEDVNAFLATAQPLKAVAPTKSSTCGDFFYSILYIFVRVLTIAKRELISLLRNPSIIVATVIYVLGTSNMYGSLFASFKDSDVLQQTTSTLRALYMVASVLPSYSQAVASPLAMRTPRLLQELHGQWYSPIELVTAQVIVDVVVQTIPALVYALCLTLWMEQLQGPFLDYAALILLYTYACLSFVTFTTAACKTFRAAYVMGGAMLGLWLAVGGFLVPIEQLPYVFYPVYYTSPSHYLFGGYLVHTYYDVASVRNQLYAKFALSWYFGAGNEIPTVRMYQVALLAFIVTFRGLAWAAYSLRKPPKKINVVM